MYCIFVWCVVLVQEGVTCTMASRYSVPWVTPSSTRRYGGRHRIVTSAKKLKCIFGSHEGSTAGRLEFRLQQPISNRSCRL